MPPPPSRNAWGRQSASTSASEFYSLSTTGHSSVSNSIADLSLQDDSETASQRLELAELDAAADEHIKEFNSLTLEDKEMMLNDMFQGIKKFDIEWTLKKYDGDLTKCIEDLLNQTFLQESGEHHKGIDGFSGNAPGADKVGKKRRRKKKKNGSETAQPETEVQKSHKDWSPRTASVWETNRRNVELIGRLTGVGEEEAYQIYRKNNSSVSSSLKDIIKQHAGAAEAIDDEAFNKTHSLMEFFSEIPFEHLVAIVTFSSKTGFAPEEFCEAYLSRRVVRRPSAPNIKLKYQSTKELLGEWNDVPSRKRPGSRDSDKTKTDYVASYAATAETGNHLAALRNENFSKASAAYRKARSDPLMGGAAAYYAQEGRNNHAQIKKMSSAAADQLVARQSNSKELDLHGVNVIDAVRIARERVTAWWVRMDKEPGASHSGFKIITGKGTHSANGVAKIRNAVGRMLIKEGWRAEIGSGAIVVRGTTGVKRGMS